MTNGLRDFSQNIKTLTSLTCSNIDSLHSSHMFLISYRLPLLVELDLSYPTKFKSYESFLNGIEALSPLLFQLRKANLTGYYYINNQSFSTF